MSRQFFRSASLALIAVSMVSTPVKNQLVFAQVITQSNYFELNNLLLEGKRLVAEQNYDKALDVYEQAANLDQNNAQIFSGIGYVHALKEEYELAADAYEQAISLSPNNSKLYYALGYSLGKSENYESAADAYEQAVSLEPNNIQNHIGLGVVLLRQQKYDPAIDVYNRVLALSPDNEKAHKVISLILVEQNKSLEAISLIQKASQQYPQLARLQILLARALVDKNDISRALEALEIAKVTDPQNHWLYLQTGDILYQQQKYDDALVEYKAASKLETNSPEAVEGKGRIYLAKKNYLRATSEFRRMTLDYPNNPVGYHYLGIALQARKRENDALSALVEAQQIYQVQNNVEAVEEITELINEINGEATEDE